MIKKVQLISNNICYGPAPEIGSEVEQHLTVSSIGKIWFNGYNITDGFDYKKGRTYQISIGKEKAKIIIDLIENYIKSELLIMATDCGTWNLKITDTNGIALERSGALIDEIFVGDIPLSETIRNLVPIDDMFLFDGNYSKDED